MLEAFKKRFPVGKGLFISFEGGEGSGKSTQIKLLAAALTEAGYEVVLFREPGGSEGGMTLRKLLVEGDADRWDGLSEVLLYSAGRNENLRHIVRPGLAAGKVVICDRFADSTLVYQGAGRKIAPEIARGITDMVVGDDWPDITLLLDISTEEGLRRAGARIEQQLQLQVNGVTLAPENRFETLGLDFHQRIRDGYLARAKDEPNRFVVVDASNGIEQVQQSILTALDQFAGRT